VTSDPDFKVAVFVKINYIKMVRDGAIVTIVHY